MVRGWWSLVRGVWDIVGPSANTLSRRRSGNLFRRRSGSVLVAAGTALERRHNKLPERRQNIYFSGYQPQTTKHKPLTRDHQAETTDHKRQTTDHRPETTCHTPKTTDHMPHTTDQRPPTRDQNPQTTDHKPNTTNHIPPPTAHRPRHTTLGCTSNTAHCHTTQATHHFTIEHNIATLAVASTARKHGMRRGGGGCRGRLIWARKGTHTHTHTHKHIGHTQKHHNTPTNQSTDPPTHTVTRQEGEGQHTCRRFKYSSYLLYATKETHITHVNNLREEKGIPSLTLTARGRGG